MADIIRLPTPVRDYQREASFDPDVNTSNAETTHFTLAGRREQWIRVKLLGRGGYGIVWLERKARNDATEEFRAVKQLEVPHSVSRHGSYIREIEALTKFSRGKVG
jgi:hypothetical protein